MTTLAYLIREAIIQRITITDYKIVRRTPVPQLQPDKLPALSIYIMQTAGTSDGDDNAAEPRIVSQDTIGISVARGFEDTVTMEGRLDLEVASIQDKLLSDPSFVRFRASYLKSPDEIILTGTPLYSENQRTVGAVFTGSVLMGVAAEDALEGTTRIKVDPLFEAVESIRRRWVFPQQGETFFAELRLEMVFRTRVQYPPRVVDTLEHIRVTSKFGTDGTPQVVAGIDLT